MNIMYLNNSSHLGGDTKCILKLCKELKKDNKIIMVSNGGILEKEFNEMGIKHYYIHDVVNKMPHIIIGNVIKLMKIIKDENIDIIHSHHRMSTLTAKIVSKFTRVKVIHTQHSCIKDKFKLTNLALSNIQTITVSESAKKILEIKSNLDGSKIKTIYNTIETENKNKIIDSKLLKLKEEEYFVIAQVSRIVEDKGVYDFVDIAELVSKQNEKIRFVIIGDGPQKEKLKEYIVKKNLQNYVFILGSKDNVIEHLKYIDLLLLCSYVEGLPLTPLEGFSQGVPAIVTNIDGCNEEVIDGYNGYLVNKKNINGFAEKIIDIFNNKYLHQNMGKNAYNIFRDKFNSDIYVNKHKEIYMKIMK